MFGFGLKLKSKPKPTISAARRPRDHVAETSQKLDAIGQAANAKQTSNENLSQSQNTNSEKSEKITPTINCAGTVIELAHPESCHLEFKKIDSKRGEEISTKSDASNSPSVVSLQNSSSSVINNDRTSSHPKINLDRDVHNNTEQNIPTTPLSTENEVLTTVDNGIEGTCSDLGNSAIVVKDANTVEGSSENVNQDSIRQKSVPFKPKLFPKKNKFVPNLRVVRKTDSNKSISISPQKNSDSINSESDTSVMTAECESHVDSDDITSIAAESLLEMSKTIPGDDLQNQSTTNEQPQGKEPPPAQPIQSSHQVSSTKEPVTSSKPILEKIADKENTICNDDNQIHNPGNILQNSKKKKPRAQGTFLQMTIEAKKELNEKLKDGVLDKSKLIMRDLILYNPTSNPMPVKSKTKCIKEEKKCKSDGKSIMDEILSEQSVDDVEATRDSDAGTMPVPKLKVGPDGKIILDSSSLVIETTGTEKSRTDLQNSELVEENEFSGFKYRKRRARRNDWSPEETVLFYKALNDLGADFSLMQALFPSRTRRDLKLKFKKEERCNLSLVDKAMTHVGKFNFEALKEELTRDRAERTKRQEEQVRVKEEAKKMLKLQKMEAKIKEKQLKAENSRKLKEERCNSKENENKNSRKGVKRSKKMPATEECKPKKRRSKKEKILDSDCDSDDNRHLDCSDESMDSCNNDNDNMCYDTIFKTTKSGRKPRVRNKIKEECERNEIKEALKIKKVSEILRDQIESVVNMNVEEEKEQQSESVSVDSVQEIEICLFEEPSNQFEESSHVQNDLVKEVQNSESKVKSILNLGSRLPNQNLPETIKIVEELTKGIPLSTVDVNGVMCKIIALNDGNACGSSTFQVRDSREDTTNSNRCFRLETVSDGAGTDCQNYVISYSENGGIVDLSSQMVTDEEPNPNRPHSDHSYCISKEFVTPDENNTELAHESYVVLKPNECVEIYNDS